MYAEDDFSKFTKNLTKYINTQWSKVKKSSTSSLKSNKNIDQELEEEYETLLREIDYLTSDKSCYLSFRNDNFTKTKSSVDLSKVLKKHSSEILKNYIKRHGEKIKNKNLGNRQDLINYVTEIVVSKHKCNNKLCTCKPKKVSKKVYTDDAVPKENGKETQTGSTSKHSSEKAIDTKPNITEKANQTKSADLGIKKVTTSIQTDDWSHDPLCKCGCCPKTESKIDNKSVITDQKPVQDASTGDRTVTASKNILTNCIGETVETNTSTNRLCVPENFEKLLKNNKSIQNFSFCTDKKDCACDAYDVKEALNRGLVLPCSDICLKKKEVSIKEQKKEKETKTNKKKETKHKKDYDSTASDGNETSNSPKSPRDDGDSKSIKEKEKEKRKEMKQEKKEEEKREKEEKQKEEKQKEKEKKEDKKKQYSSSSASSPREKPTKKEKNTTGCFGSKKKNSGCDEYCLGISVEPKSMQTLPIRTLDRNEEACFPNENGRKSAQTSTESEAATQVSTWSLDEETIKSKHDKKTSPKENNQQDRKTLSTLDNKKDKRTVSTGDSKENIEPTESKYKASKETAGKDTRLEKDIDDKEKENVDTDKRDRDNPKNLNNSTTCNKCGRMKRDCTNGCRNTIIIPYASNSNRALPAGEAESLRMLIKMQNKDTNRQFDSIMAELTHQKSEIRRLNEMYQKMMDNLYEMQKSTSSSRSQSKKPSDLSHDYRGSNSFSGKRSDTAKACGCTDNECKIIRKHETPTERNNNDSYNTVSNNSNGTNNSQLKRFGPPNTAVAINRCDVCNVEISGNNVRACMTSNPKEIDYHDGDKQRKNQLNQSKKAGGSNQNLSIRNPGLSGENGDTNLHKTDSVSTLYKKDKKHSKSEKGGYIGKRNGHEKVIDNFEIDNDPDTPRIDTKIDTEVEGSGSDQGRKTRGIYSSRVLIWLKKSWISIKHKRDECKKKHQDKLKDETWKCMLKFCHNKAKQATTGIWKATKNVF